MKRFISKYSPRYARSLVYMLQASEYKIGDFAKWHKRVKDFRAVEQRKTLVKTAKANFLLYLGYLSYYLFILIIIFSYIVTRSNLLVSVGFIVLPFVIYLKILIGVFILNTIQKPIEKIIIAKARASLKRHGGIKIAVVGSYGKTTMKEILKTLLTQGKKVRATPDNKNTPLGIARFVDSLVGNEEVLIFEMGEYYPGDIKILSQMVNPDIGFITGVNEAHLEKFKTIDVTTDTIFELADFLADKEGAKLYVNASDRIVLEKARYYKNHKSDLITYLYNGVGVESLNHNDPNLNVEDPRTDLSGLTFVLKGNKGVGVIVNSKLLGLHQIGPLSAAIHFALSLGFNTEKIELSLKKTKAFEHRLEPKELEGGVFVIDDSYNGNPEGVRAAIDFLKEIKNKRRFYVTPGLVEMGERTEEIHIQMGKWLAEAGIEKIVLIKNLVTPFVERGLREKNYKGEIIWFDSALECFASLPKMTISNDLLVYQNDWPDNYA